MNYREVEIFSPADLGTTGTKVIDINIEDSLSAIELLWQTTVVTVSDMTAPHPACISKVELVDGSDVLVSLSGEELQALCFYTMGYMPLDEITVVVGDYMRSAMPIYFGRYLYDPELAFDPKKFKNPQLKVTWDEDAANASVVANELTVRGMAFDEKKINPIGMLTSKEIKSYTPVASGYEYTTMPTDHPYRFLMIQSEATDKNPFEDEYNAYRANIGRGILIGLEFLIAADIIDTVAIEATWDNVGILGVIVLIRTFLSFTLEMEIHGKLPWK